MTKVLGDYEGNMKLEQLVNICWIVANAEAKRPGATRIEPIHFLLGVLKIVDPQFPNQLEELNLETDEWAAWCKSAKHVRNYIDIPPERVTAKRRALRARLDAKRTAPPITADGFLHRSDALRRAFADAVPFSEGDTLTLYALVRVLFEQNLVSLDDIKG